MYSTVTTLSIFESSYSTTTISAFLVARPCKVRVHVNISSLLLDMVFPPTDNNIRASLNPPQVREPAHKEVKQKKTAPRFN